MIKTINLQKSYGQKPNEVYVLQDIDLQIESGEFVALMGPSGSGKSTLLGIIAGIDSPTSGKIEIAGVDVSNSSEDSLARFRNENIGIVFQSFNLIPSLTALQNVEAPLYASPRRNAAALHGGASITARAKEMLARVGLEKRFRHRPEQLSGGEQQRVAIARALITNPKVLIADEPTGNLDSVTGEKVLQQFIQLHRELQVTMVIATHSNEVAAAADRVVQIKDGRIVR
jgi:putative ABC transport system ATP-binding protein